MIPSALGGLGRAFGLGHGTDAVPPAARSAREAIFADLRDGLFVLGSGDRVVELNRTAERLLGRTSTDVVGKLATEVFDGELRTLHDALAANGESGEVELGDASSRRVYEVRLIPLANRDGTMLGRVLILRDVTTYRRAETLLHARFLADASAVLASSLDYEATLQQVARLAIPALGDWCTVYMLSEDSQIRRVAVAYTDGEKAELAQALRRYPPSPVSPRSSVAEAMRTRTSILTPSIPDTYVSNIAQDAEHLEIMRRLDFRCSMTVPLEARGDVLGALAFFSSDPDRRYDAADLALAEDLARRAGLAVDNARLYRESQRAIRARDEFLSVAAHELKTPMTSMLGFSQMLLRYMAPDQQIDDGLVQRALQAIEQQSERLSRLVSRLLDIARIEGGRLNVEPTDVEVVSLVNHVVETTLAASPGHRIDVRAPDQLHASLDPLRFEQVVTNLLDNAVKFSPSGAPVTVDLSLTSLDMVQLTVADRGPGIPQEDRGRIFERFYQAQTGNLSSGMGLGLYICRQIVEQHGGSIAVELPPEGGTRFVVVVPVGGPGPSTAAADS
ncbi:MAG: ATP-binding protein [Chloroflexota bacterium]